MNYPVWDLTSLTGGTLIALIAIIHVYIAHFAVGGGLFLWLTDLKAEREKDTRLLKYVDSHTWFFLLVTMVLGGVTGVGIWFIIALVNPAATSVLIHNFVFGWAIEWVFFFCEIAALLIYHYKFNDLKVEKRQKVAFLYFLFAWLSLFVINGILSFMLTPGKWLETGNFWHGFLNPTFFPSLIFRTAFAAMIAGLFGFVTAVFQADGEFRAKLMRYCSKWLIAPVLVFIPSAIWYYYALPENIQLNAFGINTEIPFYLSIFIISSIAVFLLGLFLAFKSSHLLQKVVTLLLVVIGLAWIGGFEYVRELARRPYVISDLIYSNSIFVKDQEKLNEEGVLAHAVWVEHREITEENKFEVGREIFRLQCQSCHSIGGIRNDIVSRSGHLTHLGIKAQLTGQGKIRKYMPEFVGTDEEMEALAAYISFWIHGYKPSSDLDKYNLAGVDQNVPEFDHENDDYVLLVWNDLGMHCISDSDPWFVILPPANTLEAQLIKRGETPEKVIAGAKLTYKVEPGFENPSAHVPFWDYEDKNFGVELQENVGLFGLGLEGEMHFDPERVAYIAEAIPVVPYNDDGSFNPYPLFTVEARDSASGELLISTKVVAPTSTEMGCRNCHGGDWAVNDIAGVSEETAVNILKAHDRLSGTNLHEEALNGNPKLCASCHGDPALGTEGKDEHLYMSQAVHGWHASYMPVEGGDACVLCHPAFMHGQTRCNRGVHGALGKTCDHCHGTLSDHAAALLKAQIDRPSAKSLLEPLEPVQVASIDDINPRMPWIQEPDCITCHVDFEQPSPDARAFNVWNEEFSELYRMRTGYAGIRCEACHNSPHSLYPAFNMFSHDRDNLQPLQYSGMRYPLGSNESCEVCHTIEMDFTVHHENMLRPFRNHDLIEEIHKDIRPTQVSR